MASTLYNYPHFKVSSMAKNPQSTGVKTWRIWVYCAQFWFCFTTICQKQYRLRNVTPATAHVADRRFHALVTLYEPNGCIRSTMPYINTLRPRQDGRHFADDIFTCIFFKENCCILIKFSLKYVRKGPIDNNPALVQIMAWRRPGDKPLSEPMMVSLLTHICVTRPQWVNRPNS